jgi:hypothetical protein
MKTNVVMTPQGVEVVVSLRSTPLKDQIAFTPLAPLTGMDYEAQSSGIDFVENLVTLLVDVASIQRHKLLPLGAA